MPLQKSFRRRQYLFGLFLPLVLVVFILIADILEGPKTAYVGVLACVAPLAAAFGSIRMIVSVSVAAFFGAFSIGYFASDGNVAAQNTRLVIIFIVSLLALSIAAIRISAQSEILNMTTELAVAQAINNQAEQDFLTGNLNRHGIVTRLNDFDNAIKSVVMIDLDKFKSINDLYGHKIGDEYIKAVVGRISSNLKSEDIFGRWGGDEFVAVLPHDDNRTSEIFKRVIEQATLDSFQIDSTEIPMKFSAGVALWTPEITFESALQNADKALYEAKHRGGTQVVRYSELPNQGQVI